MLNLGKQFPQQHKNWKRLRAWRRSAKTSGSHVWPVSINTDVLIFFTELRPTALHETISYYGKHEAQHSYTRMTHLSNTKDTSVSQIH